MRFFPKQWRLFIILTFRSSFAFGSLAPRLLHLPFHHASSSALGLMVDIFCFCYYFLSFISISLPLYVSIYIGRYWMAQSGSLIPHPLSPSNFHAQSPILRFCCLFRVFLLRAIFISYFLFWSKLFVFCCCCLLSHIKALNEIASQFRSMRFVGIVIQKLLQ